MPSTSPISEPNRPTQPDDGTRKLLQWGGSMVGTGVLCVLLLVTVLGGYSRLGASTNAHKLNEELRTLLTHRFL